MRSGVAIAGATAAIICCYFGALPWYFRYFLRSCCFNQSIDFIIVTDNLIKQEMPQNVRAVYISLNDFRKLSTAKLGFMVSLEETYKLCDFKPAYGYLFPELVEGYDFWGHGDIDIIFGNIRKFMTPDVLDNHDVICVRHDFMTGYFTLFRNCSRINELFKQSKDYQKVLGSERHFCFDETNFRFKEFSDGLAPDEIDSEIESMTHVVKKLHAAGEIRAYFDFHVIEGTPGRLLWHNGTLTYKNKYEVMLYHLIKLKTIYKPVKPTKEIPNKFRISPTRIY